MSKKPIPISYSAPKHRNALIGYMSAYDNDDLSDGAWQAMLEDGAKAFSKEFGIRIDPFDAFMEYVNHSGDQA